MTALEEKAREIEALLDAEVVDLWRLRELALTEGGLVDDSLRRRAWPKLVGLHDLWSGQDAPPRRGSASDGGDDSTGSGSSDPATDGGGGGGGGPDRGAVTAAKADAPLQRQSSLDADQVALDVARCTWHLLTGTQRLQRLQMEHKRNPRVARLIRRKQQRLARLINATLVGSYATAAPLRYSQGYHDVACIFLGVLGGTSGLALPGSAGATAAPRDVDLAAAVLLRVSQHQLRDCLRNDFTALRTVLRCTIFPLLAVLDPELHAHLYAAGMEPFFALSWVLTWFAHEVRDTTAVKRLFDAFLVGHPLLPVYLSVAMVAHPTNRREILDCEPDFSVLHQTLRGLPKNSSPVGWKYRPGEGYVSDDDAHGDDSATVSTRESGMTDAAEILLVERLDEEDHHGRLRSSSAPPRSEDPHHPTAASVVSSTLSSLEPPAPVAFQELLDSALELLARVPPRRLLGLAARYHGRQELRDMLAECDGAVRMFDAGLPDELVQSTAHADWVYRQWARERALDGGDGDSGRTDRRRRHSRRPSLSRTLESSLGHDDRQRELSLQHIKSNPKSAPVIALGLGTGDHEERKRRRRRKMAQAGAVAVVVLAVAVGVAMRYDAQLTESDGDTRRTNIDPMSFKPQLGTTGIATGAADASGTVKRSARDLGEQTESEPATISELADEADLSSEDLFMDDIDVSGDTEEEHYNEEVMYESIQDDSGDSHTEDHEIHSSDESWETDSEDTRDHTAEDFDGDYAVEDSIHLNKVGEDDASDRNPEPSDHDSMPVETISSDETESFDDETHSEFDSSDDLVLSSQNDADSQQDEFASDYDSDFDNSVESDSDDESATLDFDSDYDDDDDEEVEQPEFASPDNQEITASSRNQDADDSAIIPPLPSWGNIRKNYTAMFALAKRISLREAARAKSYFDHVQHAGLGAHLARMLDDAHKLIAHNEVCKTRSDSEIDVFVKARFGIDCEELATNGKPALLGQRANARRMRLSREWQTFTRHVHHIRFQLRQSIKTMHSSYIEPQISLLMWISDGVIHEFMESQAGQLAITLIRRVSTSEVFQLLSSKIRHLLHKTPEVILQA